MTNPASEMTWVSDHAEGALLRLRIIPRAPHNRVEGPLGDALKIRLQAPPVDGEANVALIRFLAEALDISRSAIRLVSGATGRNKVVLVSGLRAAAVQARLVPRTGR